MKSLHKTFDILEYYQYMTKKKVRGYLKRILEARVTLKRARVWQVIFLKGVWLDGVGIIYIQHRG